MKACCENCNTRFTRKPRLLNKYEHHFCCPKCYYEWRAVHPENRKNQHKDLSSQKKILELAEKRNEVYKARLYE